MYTVPYEIVVCLKCFHERDIYFFLNSLRVHPYISSGSLLTILTKHNHNISSLLERHHAKYETKIHFACFLQQISHLEQFPDFLENVRCCGSLRVVAFNIIHLKIKKFID